MKDMLKNVWEAVLSLCTIVLFLMGQMDVINLYWAIVPMALMTTRAIIERDYLDNNAIYVAVLLLVFSTAVSWICIALLISATIPLICRMKMRNFLEETQIAFPAILLLIAIFKWNYVGEFYFFIIIALLMAIMIDIINNKKDEVIYYCMLATIFSAVVRLVIIYWEIALILAALLSIVIAIIFIQDRKRKRENKNSQIKKEEEAKMVKESINKTGKINVSQIKRIFGYNVPQNLLRNKEVICVSASKIKKQIAYNPADIVFIIQLLEDEYQRSFDDKVIEDLIKTIKSFLSFPRDYEGSKSLINLINKESRGVIKTFL